MSQRYQQEEDNLSIHSSLSSTPTETTPLVTVRLPNNEKEVSTYTQEFKWLIKNALPVVFTFLMQNSLQMASIFTLGHLVR
jgi:MATE family multidrug resistance protein